MSDNQDPNSFRSLKYDYPASDTFYDKSEGFSLCACIGAGYGEPYCPCRMAREGLPMSVSHVIAHQESMKRFKEAFEDMFNRCEE